MTQQQISSTWNSLTKAQQRREWTRFIEAVDCGDAGYHRFYPILAPLWDRGERP